MEDAPLSESKAEEAAGPSSSDEPSVISVPVVSEPVPVKIAHQETANPHTHPGTAVSETVEAKLE